MKSLTNSIIMKTVQIWNEIPQKHCFEGYIWKSPTKVKIS